MAAAPVRFRDPRRNTTDFLHSIMVRCPACTRSARVVPAPDADTGPGGGRTLFAPRRLVCRHCGLSRSWSDRVVAFSRGRDEPATDPYFGAPLALQTETRHGRLWAYDLEHLDLIRRFVRASLRERAPWYDTGQKMTLVARLPAWITRARNREEVLRAIARIHRSSAGTG
ncbi:hypothetical protein [Streptomyces sp. NPDC058955]|uniref:hypothetical protein n=1 Tax=unclassified Streptomyces TaxID=2593676 RepID=UPI00364B0D17